MTDPMPGPMPGQKPRPALAREQFLASERQTELPLPEAAGVQESAAALALALKTGQAAPVKASTQVLLEQLAAFYRVPQPALSVLGVRPRRSFDVKSRDGQTASGTATYELFGDYTPSAQKIRVWMRTAVLGKVTSYRGLLNTILHEFCHHLDVQGLGYDDTPHTRGFYSRVDELYHLALNTPAERRRPLVWRRRGGVWAIDWTRTRGATGQPVTEEDAAARSPVRPKPR